MGHAAKKDRAAATTTTTTPEPEPVKTGTEPEPEPIKTEAPEGFLSSFYRMIDAKPIMAPEEEEEPTTTPEPIKGFRSPEYTARDKEEEAAREFVGLALLEAIPAVLATIGRRLAVKVEREALDVTLLLSAFLSVGWSKAFTACLLPTLSGGMLEVQFRTGSSWTSASKLDATAWKGNARIVGLFPRTKPQAAAYGLSDEWLNVNATFNQRHAKPKPVVITLPDDIRKRLAAAVK